MSPINTSQLNASLLQMFRAHGIDCTQQGDWIVFQKNDMKSGMKANAIADKLRSELVRQ